MAQYGSERPGGRGGRLRGRRHGWGWWAGGEPEYGWEYREAPRRWRGMPRRGEYGTEMGYGERPAYGADIGYGAELESRTGRGYGVEERYEPAPGYEAREGYGVWSDYGEAEVGAYGYDFEFGGRGWPYGEMYGPWREEYVRRRRRRPRYGREYDWELRGPGGYGMYYGYEYTRSGAPGYRRARGRAPASQWYRGAERRSRYWPGRAGEEMYGGEEGRAWAGRFEERGVAEPIVRREEPRYGRTPPDRWPETGHDLDELPPEERAMSDRDVQNAVLENLFQDNWIDPEQIDVDVRDGVVTLTGEVLDYMEARYAWDDAWESKGVRGVVNNLTVRADLPQEEMEMPQTAERYRGERARRPARGRRRSTAR